MEFRFCSQLARSGCLLCLLLQLEIIFYILPIAPCVSRLIAVEHDTRLQLLALFAAKVNDIRLTWVDYYRHFPPSPVTRAHKPLLADSQLTGVGYSLKNEPLFSHRRHS